jgi:hypothetical protein
VIEQNLLSLVSLVITPFFLHELITAKITVCRLTHHFRLICAIFYRHF